jgi:uncharacterized protein YjbJ (UPF0337 family)
MDKDRIDGAATQAKGAIKEVVGSAKDAIRDALKD